MWVMAVFLEGESELPDRVESDLCVDWKWQWESPLLLSEIINLLIVVISLFLGLHKVSSSSLYFVPYQGCIATLILALRPQN